MASTFPCKFCGGVTTNDKLGNCSACGAPRDPQSLRLYETKAVSFPGLATRQVTFATSTLGRSKSGLVVDLNKYRANKNLKLYMDAGVDLFYLRIGGPFQWVNGNYKYQEDPSWRPYLEELDKLGMKDKTIGYIVHNPFEDWRLKNNVHVDLLNQWTSQGYMPASFMVDHEIAHVWQGEQKIQVTPFNLVSSLAATVSAISKWSRKVCGVYTARWFINSYGYSEHETYFDNVNKPVSLGGPGLQVPTIFAWYGHQDIFTKKSYDNLKDCFNDVLVPTGDQIGKLLSIGSYTQGSHQFTDRLKLRDDKIGVDANITRGSLEDFMVEWGLKDDVTLPPEPPPNEEPKPTNLEARVAKLEQWAQSFKL